MAPPADGGMEASKRMHEYLLSKQRKQEEFWLRKYGKVLAQPPPSLGRPTGSPHLPPLDGSSTGGASGNASSSGSNNGGGPGGEPSGLLPPLSGAKSPAPGPPPPGLPSHHHRQPKGHAPIFHANEPVKDFFSRNTRQPRASGVQVSRDELGSALPPSHRPPEPYRRAPPSQLPPMAGGYGQQQLQQRLPNSEHSGELQHQQQQQQQQHHAQAPQQEYSTYADTPSRHHPPPPTYQHPYQHHQQSPSPRGGYGPSPRGAGSGGGGVQPRSLPPLPPESSSARSPHSVGVSNPGKPIRNLEMELTVIRAIKAREDVLERLRVASGKLDSGFGGSAPVVLSPVDPLVRLFYRLVGTLRQRTLDVIEAIAAWRRKVNPSDPFIYFGVDYLAALGPDLGFLDELPFMRTRLIFGRAADDPFLAEVTPDGIPIEEATTCDLRRGGQRFSSDALRIRMARKVLARYCGRPMPGADPSSFSVLEESSNAMSSGGGAAAGGGYLQNEASQPRSPLSAALAPAGPGQGEEAAAEVGGGMTTAQIMRALSPPVASATSLQQPPPAARAITPPAETGSMTAVAEEEEAARPAGRSLMAEISEAAPREQGGEEEEDEDVVQREEEEPEQEEEAAVEAQEEAEEEEAVEAEADVRAEEVGGQDELEALPEPEDQQQLEEEEKEAEDTAAEGVTVAADADAADVAVEQEAVPEQTPQPLVEDDLLVFEDDNDFIDFALGAIIHSLEQPYANAIPPGAFTVAGWEIDRQLDEVVRGIASPERSSRLAARAAALAASREGTASQLRSSAAATPPPPAAAAAAELAPPPSRGSGRIPQPPPDPKPPSRGRVSDVGPAPPSSRGSRIPTPPMVARPPVRVHLRPNSRGLDMGLSMDVEELAVAESASLRPGSTGRPMGRPGSRGASAGAGRFSSGSGGLGLGSEQVEALPPISEDQSAFFAGRGGEDGETAAAASAGGPRPPVRVHLRPNSRGLDMGLSMDVEELAATESASLRPGSSGRPMGRPGSSGGLGPTQGSGPAYPEALPAISEDQSAFFGGGGGAAEDGEDDAGAAAAAGVVTVAGSRPPVRVHLRPNSRELNMLISMDEDGMMLASPAAAPAPAVGSALELEAPIEADEDAASPAVPRLADMPVPLQGSLSGRSNRASLRLSRQGGGSRPGSAASQRQEP